MPSPIRKSLAAAMILAPLLALVSAIVAPPLKSGVDARLAEIARHHDRWYLYALFITLSGWLFVLAVLGLIGIVCEQAPRLSVVGGALALVGAFVAVGDGTVELMYWQMGAPGADRAQMAGARRSLRERRRNRAAVHHWRSGADRRPRPSGRRPLANRRRAGVGGARHPGRRRSQHRRLRCEQQRARDRQQRGPARRARLDRAVGPSRRLCRGRGSRSRDPSRPEPAGCSPGLARVLCHPRRELDPVVQPE